MGQGAVAPLACNRPNSYLSVITFDSFSKTAKHVDRNEHALVVLYADAELPPAGRHTQPSFAWLNAANICKGADSHGGP